MHQLITQLWLLMNKQQGERRNSLTQSNGDSAYILYRLLCLNKQISPKFERCTGIGPTRLDLLHQLYQVDEMNQTDLQKEVNIDPAAVTRHLKQLEADGMVTRRKSAADNRVTFVSLTDHGRTEIISFREEKGHFLSQLLHNFTQEERHLLADMLKRMQHNMNEL
ncbi:DNA-binding MarR family transcriptional regulator [Paenibacillus baekrokdamisoli]|nr:MarR family transcriptional regulator [Paenibacillus baekrokdamisoli]MBB3067736.1 DNA-binding MarR family transcriptional regulator [Paenibacillus baekrokdamisoli]